MTILAWSYTVEDIPLVNDPGPAIARKDYALDPLTGDLAIPMRLVGGVDAVAQRLAIRMGFWRGDWFLDLREGVPYLQNVFIRNPDLALVESFFRRIIRETPGVSRILSYTHNLHKPTRTYSARARVSAGGRAISLANQPFIVGNP